MKFVLELIKVYFRSISAISPKLASRHGFILFQKTASSKFKPKEEEFYNSSSTFIAESSRGEIVCYENGDPNGKLAFLVHGWNSNAGSMFGIGKALVKEGYHVISFDLPAHGKSIGKYTNLVYCKDALQAVLNRVRTDEPITIVSHSFGSLVSAYTLSSTSIQVDKMIFLTCPNKVTSIFEEFRDTVGLGKKAYGLMVERTESILKEKLENVTLRQKLSQANYKNLVLMHDVHDKILPYSNSVEIVEQLSNTKLHTFEKVGHYRMLWNLDVISVVLNSLKKEEKETMCIEVQESVCA